MSKETNLSMLDLSASVGFDMIEDEFKNLGCVDLVA